LSSDAGKLKVLFVCSSLSGGGAERFVSTVLGFLDRSRFAPALCLLRREIDYALPDDVPLEVLGKRRPWQIGSAIVRLARLLERAPPEVVVSAFSHPSFVTGNALALCRSRPRWIARVSSDPDLTERGPLRSWMRRLYRRADRVLANSKALCERFDAVHPTTDGARYLPNASDFEALDALAREPVPEPPAGRRRLVTAGRLEAVKRFDVLIEALARLRERFDLELVICGDGAEHARLERQAQRLGLSDRVRFAGFVANPFAWFAASDCFVLSSDSEGLPNALVEAQGLGLAAVATDCPSGPREIIDDGETGRLVPTGDPEALAGALAELLADEDARRAMGAAARERSRARYSAPTVTRALEEILLGVSAR
jgi:glycosyltransferase involved in cell wall biosynthesis